MKGMPSAADFLELPRGVHRHFARLDHARTGDQEQRLIQAGFEVAEFHIGLSRAWLASSAGVPFARPATAPSGVGDRQPG